MRPIVPHFPRLREYFFSWGKTIDKKIKIKMLEEALEKNSL